LTYYPVFFLKIRFKMNKFEKSKSKIKFFTA